MTQLLRVQNFTVDRRLRRRRGPEPGAALRPRQPRGADRAGPSPRRAGPPPEPGGSQGLDDYFIRDFPRNIGAEIMGRNKFGPQRGPARPRLAGWWGEEPPFHTPVFVLTHHPRPSFTLSDTTFHFVEGDPAEVLGQAREAAQGKDVRLGGGVTTIREFLDADLVDTLHVAVAPIELGSGLRLWDSPDELRDRFDLEVVPSPSGVTHHLFWRDNRAPGAPTRLRPLPPFHLSSASPAPPVTRARRIFP